MGTNITVDVDGSFNGGFARPDTRDAFAGGTYAELSPEAIPTARALRRSD